MKYRKEFQEERAWLLDNGLPEELVEDFYLSTALHIIRSDDRFNEHNLTMFGQPESYQDKDDEQFGIFAYQRGSQRQKSQAETEDQTGWCAIKMCIMPLSCYDETDTYLESVSIVEQLEEPQLQTTIANLSDRRQYILELLLDGWSKKSIAKYLGISSAAVSKHVAVIKKELAPYFIKYHWLKLN